VSIKLLLIAAFLNGLLWSILIPIWQYPDEQAHFSQVQNIAELGSVPSGLNTSQEIHLSELVMGTSRTGDGNNKFTYNSTFNIKYSNERNGYYERALGDLPVNMRTNLVKRESTQNPPLYYNLGAIMYKSVYKSDILTRVFAVRLLSVSFFVATVWVAFLFAKVILPKNEFFRIGLPTTVAFQPMFVFSSTGVLPDALTNLLFSIVILLAVLIYKKGLSVTIFIFCAIVVFLGYKTRQQFPISLAFIVSALILRAYNNLGSIRRLQRVLILIATLIVLLTLGLFIGAPETGSLINHLGTDKPLSNYILHSLTTSYSQTWPWYIGVYRWLSLSLPPVTYQIINRVVLLAVLGLILLVFRSLIFRKNANMLKNIILLLTISATYFLTITIWDVMHRLQFGYPFGIQGRYFFPTILSNIALFIIGIHFLLKVTINKYEKHLLIILTILVIIFNNFSLFYITSSYYEINSLSTFLSQASQYKADVIKGNAILTIMILAVLSQIMYAVQVCKLNFTDSHESA